MKLLLLFITECIIWIENVILLLSRQQNFMRILSTYIHKMTYIIIYWSISLKLNSEHVHYLNELNNMKGILLSELGDFEGV